MIITDSAIILHSRKYSETSKILTVYSAEHGKLSLLAKGARSPKSKFGASLEALSHSMITVYKKPQRDLHLITKAETATPLRRIAEDYSRLTIGLAIAELTSVTQEPEEVNSAIFELLCTTLILLNKTQNNEYALLVAFQIRLADLMGFATNFTDCYVTGVSLINYKNQEFVFSISDGGIMSPEVSQYREGFVFETKTLSILQLIAECELSQAINVDIPELQKAQIHDFFAQYYGFHLDKRLHYRTHKLILHTD
ncbi:MAG: DNA repair protein RecO [Ignavibacteria bacterium]|nr:DNA repair protein RecO [Ignavibacteria bacterium]